MERSRQDSASGQSVGRYTKDGQSSFNEKGALENEKPMKTQ